MRRTFDLDIGKDRGEKLFRIDIREVVHGCIFLEIPINNLEMLGDY